MSCVHCYVYICFLCLSIRLPPISTRTDTRFPSTTLVRSILVLSAISIGLGLSVHTVGDMGNLPEGLPSFAFPQVPLTLVTLQVIFPYSITIAAVGLLESLQTAQIVDDITDTGSITSRECAGPGSAKIAEEVLGRLGGCAWIGRSVRTAA